MSKLLIKDTKNRGCFNCGCKNCWQRSIGKRHHMICHKWEFPPDVVVTWDEEK